MNHVYQRGSHDCGVAALAMFCDTTYEEMLTMCLEKENEDDEYPIYREGWGMSKERAILKRLGLWDYPSQLGKDAPFKVMKFPKPHAIEAEYFRNIAWGRRALMMVPSLNVEGGYHFVCYDGYKVLDPNDPTTGKKVYTKLEELKPIEMWVMREV